ncbi:hypothetical protein KIN20_002845 [Parelaphostrongylus tenuis]|uniref:Uncharacterized protein n=1 Tax=Parelaphostrongylus tenuis TaxID=148309 RepID=A0AAD5QD92_PARTN|nr:hypothetical protein KIN20_002845 [Parelaphostrongylus tenuis]
MQTFCHCGFRPTILKKLKLIMAIAEWFGFDTRLGVIRRIRARAPCATQLLRHVDFCDPKLEHN